MKKSHIFFGALILVFVGVLFVTSRKKDQNQEITLGFVAPLSGDLANVGETERIATQIAIDEINVNGEIDGKRLRVVYEDGKCDGKTAASAAEKLISVDKVRIILGGLCSGETLSMAPITERNKVLLFSAFSSSPDITNAGNYVFRNGPSDLVGGTDLARYIVDKQYRKLALISEDAPYTQGLKAALKNELLKTQSSEIVIDENYSPGTKNFRSIVTKLFGKDVDAIFLNPNSQSGAGTLAKTVRELGSSQPLFGNLTFESEPALSAAPQAIEGLIYVNAPSTR